GLGQRQFVHDFAADARLALRQHVEDGDARRVPERFRPRCQPHLGVGKGLDLRSSHFFYRIFTMYDDNIRTNPSRLQIGESFFVRRTLFLWIAGLVLVCQVDQVCQVTGLFGSTTISHSPVHPFSRSLKKPPKHPYSHTQLLPYPPCPVISCSSAPPPPTAPATSTMPPTR